MSPFLVIPCLNEENRLLATCSSLGFGLRGHDPSGRLVLIDNGSTDATWKAMGAVIELSPPGSVVRIHENKAGVDAARHAGAAAVAKWADEIGLAPHAALLLQADADTIYSEGYVKAMADEARIAGPHALLEARMLPSSADDGPLSRFRGLERVVDAEINHLIPESTYDVIVDDKVAGYLLADYFKWGGHRPSLGGELLAETSRLFLGARLMGGHRRLVEDASAKTSARRVLEDPALAFATAGFPPGRAWRKVWHAAYKGPSALQAFDPEGDLEPIAQAIAERRRHLVAMFGILPAFVARSLGNSDGPGDGRYDSLLDELMFPTLEDAIRDPGLALRSAFAVTHERIASMRR